jgi:hypothetical protein
MRLAKRTLLASFAALIAVLCCTRLAFYRLPPARVRVVDLHTRKPVAGAVVSARWYAAHLITLEGGRIVAEIGVAEGVTGESGRAVVRGPYRLRKGLTGVDRGSPEIAVASAGRLFVHFRRDAPEGPTYYLLPVADVPDATGRLAMEVRWARRDGHTLLDIPLTEQPLLKREILKTYARLPGELRRRVDAELDRKPD